MPHPAVPARCSRQRLRVVAALLLSALIGGATSGPPTGLRAATQTALLTTSPAALPTVTPRPAATPTARVIELAPATASPVPTVSPSPSPTAPPTTTPSPTPLPPPTATLPPVLEFPFAAEDWAGGYYRGDGRWYGRTWVAIYGQASPYPAAWLTFPLDAAPSGPATVTITGLDDEWASQNPIVVLVNGTVLYDGVSPWPNWDGVGHGADAAWTSATFAIPAGVLQPGSNQIVVANRSPSANFGLPPYVLVSDATLVTSGG